MIPRMERLLVQDRAFHIALFVLLSAIVSSLFYITYQMRQESELLPVSIAAYFDASLLKDGPPANLIATMQAQEAQLRRDFESLRGLYLSIRDRERDVLVYPPFRDEQPPPEAHPVPILLNGRNAGTLYVYLEDSRLKLMSASSWAAAAISLLVFLAVVSRARRQERRIRETIVELARKQEELIGLERLALVGQLTAGILHDLKKPVLNIRDEAASLGETPEGREIREQVDLFFQILREADVEGFLRRDYGREEYLEPADIIRKSVSLVRYESDGAVFHVDIADDLPLLLGIRHRMIQVFSNLFLNALQATGGRGEIRITASTSSAGGTRWLEFAVGDNGPGIPPDIRSRIFEPLFSGGKGTGLGLYIVRSIVEGMGGRVEVSSREDKGTTFVLTFPIEEDRQNEPHQGNC